MKHSSWMAALAVAAACGLLLWLWLDRSGPPPALAPMGTGIESTAPRPGLDLTEPEDLRLLNTTAPSALPALPDPQAPLVQRLDQLAERFRAGDAASACRIAAELVRCRTLRNTGSFSDDRAIDALARMDLDDAELESRTAELDRLLAQNRRARSDCEALEPARVEQASRYFLAAARRGHVPSMQQFANAVGIDGESLLRDPQLYHAYRMEAWPMFQRAFESGHPAAASMWHWALESRGFAFFAGVIPDEWRQTGTARALSQLMAEELGYAGDRSRMEGVEPEDYSRAQVLFDTHFRGSPWLEQARQQALAPQPPFVGAPRLPDYAAQCEDAGR
ncbi:MAG: hypothetical protein MEQ07_05280 [Aquimonas sp.]|nr:hypothetical protein [Aquimonas sp.]